MNVEDVFLIVMGDLGVVKITVMVIHMASTGFVFITVSRTNSSIVTVIIIITILSIANIR